MSNDVDNLLDLIQNQSSLKVWSMIITFFGDAIVARGGNVSSKTIQQVLARFGIEPGAVRTACSRLASDKWIVRTRVGRESYFDLAEDGYLPFKQAAARIYAPGSVNDQDCLPWHVVIANPDANKKPQRLLERGLRLTGNAWLLTSPSDTEKAQLQKHSCFLFDAEFHSVPDWVKDKIHKLSGKKEFESIISQFSCIQNARQIDPFESVVLRCLLIHQWRRALLKCPGLPVSLTGVDWPESLCRTFVRDLYAQLLPRSESWLDEFATCVDGRIPASDPGIFNRFSDQYSSAERW